MATYNLDNSHLASLLATLKSPYETARIIGTLANAGLWPAGSTTLPVEVQTTPGTYVVPGSGQLFLYAGAPGTTATVFDSGGNVLADPGNINYVGTGNDTLVGGDGSGSLNVAFGNNLLVAGSMGSGVNTLAGGSGNDTMLGSFSGGNTLILAGTGADDMIGGVTLGAHDTIYGWTGADSMSSVQGDTLFFAGSGANTIWGGSGSDTMYGGGHTLMLAGTGNAYMIGGANAGFHDTLQGGSGNDTMGSVFGGTTFITGSGNDSIFGGTSADTVTAGLQGNATVYGGTSTTVNEANSQASIASQSVFAGVTYISFSDGQQLASAHVTIHFNGGGTITT